MERLKLKVPVVLFSLAVAGIIVCAAISLCRVLHSTITLSEPRDRQKIYTQCVYISDTAFNGLVLIVYISEPRAIYHFRLFVLRSLAVYNYDFTIEAARQSENVLNANRPYIQYASILCASLLDQLNVFASVF